ncbi:MAG: Glyoxalase-like domain [Solirubrobacterales bacterium]|jgi:catechol 2,3-dioxygenase-like lactoylglutathione lyase family enzyme|nr:Glyoxalase-like domain [Solirubrobacterales bacterium]
MLHHVGIEVAPAEIERAVELWQLLGFSLVDPPESLSEFTWLERDGTQVHLMPTEFPTVPPRGHTAIVVADFELTFNELREHGFEVERHREHWGVPRAVVIAPAGHRVELMAAPPSPRKR